MKINRNRNLLPFINPSAVENSSIFFLLLFLLANTGLSSLQSPDPIQFDSNMIRGWPAVGVSISEVTSPIASSCDQIEIGRLERDGSSSWVAAIVVVRQREREIFTGKNK